MGKEELSFTIYCTGILAERLEISEREAYHLLCKGDIVDDSKTWELMSEGVSDFHCLSDNYLVDNLNREYHLGKYAACFYSTLLTPGITLRPHVNTNDATVVITLINTNLPNAPIHSPSKKFWKISISGRWTMYAPKA